MYSKHKPVGAKKAARKKKTVASKKPAVKRKLTPSNEELLKLATKFPPPSKYFEGEEEMPFDPIEE
jgi:hypothetical protein